jgi:hypothetical protein
MIKTSSFQPKPKKKKIVKIREDKKMDRLNHFYFIFRLLIIAVFVLFLVGNGLAASIMCKLKNGKKRVEVNNREDYQAIHDINAL